MPPETEEPEVWATIELMGHAETAGRISRPADWGGLLRVDRPIGEDGDYLTEYYGMSAIYSIKIVSREIARVYARRGHASRVVAYDTPIISREQHESAMHQAQMENHRLQNHIQQLEHRLTAINALPAPESDDDSDDPGF